MKILIVGGGAAGMMGALTALRKKTDLDLYIAEKNNEMGRKVVISGGGRCNLTTAEVDFKRFLSAYPRGSKWLRYVMKEFSPQKAYSFFENELKIPLKIEGQKVFPESNKGTDVVSSFARELDKKGAKILYRHSVKSMKKTEDGIEVELEVEGKTTTMNFDKVLIATGGSAYGQTGSTGDGYSLAKSLGHTITPLRPTLTSFKTQEKWANTLSGVSLKDVKLKVVGLKKYEAEGAMLFTHFGISGPAVFKISSLSAEEQCTNSSPLNLFLDLLPAKTYEDVKSGIINEEQRTAGVKMLFRGEIPKSLMTVILNNLKISLEKKAGDLSKKEVNRIIEEIKNMKLKLVGRPAGSEIVTAGGVDLSEVDQKTMESKIVHGLYFAGEILNADGFTGGFNLQLAWATGFLAGRSFVSMYPFSRTC